MVHGLLRNSQLLATRLEASDADIDTGVWAVRPVEADPQRDDHQTFHLIVFVEQTGQGSVTIETETSWGDGLWLTAVRPERTEGDAAQLGDVLDLSNLGPYVRFRVLAKPGLDEVKPTFKCVLRLTSNGPFRAEPATPPVVLVQTPVDGGA